MKAVVWCIAGTDSSGGAGLAADQRAVEAFEGVHFCGVVAAVTAQNSRAVTQVAPMPVALLDAQMHALAQDMPPTVLKTGLLGGAEQVRCVARWVDRLRAERPGVALVVDPVLAASSGAVLADDATRAAYREWLLPRATLVTPNQREAALLLQGGHADTPYVPALGRALRQAGAQAVCVTGGDAADHGAGRLVLDWLDSEHAQGWLALPRVDTTHTHGTGCTFAASAAAALALGFVPADAVVLAKMATAQALRHGHAAGAGAGQVGSARGFHAEPALLPHMGWGEAPAFSAPPARGPRPAPLGLYAIVGSAEQALAVLAAGVRTLQLRIKTPDDADAAWWTRLEAAVRTTAQACRAAGARLFVNDHWLLAVEYGADGVHLGQEDLLALGERGRDALAASGLALGVSSHSLWELARARTLGPAYIACGPVWPTLTKAMPWLPQGLDNLRWWCAMAGAPVVAIGGILTPAQITQAAACGADGVCVVRMLGPQPADTVPPMQAALAAAPSRPLAVAGWPHPSLYGRGDRVK